MKKPSSTITSEKTLKRYVCWLLEEQGFDTQEHERTQNAIGIPDVSYGIKGINGWIEFKWEHGKYQRGQEKWLRFRAHTGGHCFTITGWPGSMTVYSWVTGRRSEILFAQWPSDLPPVLMVPQERRIPPSQEA